MKPHVLFLVHCEEQFRSHFPDKAFVARLRKSCQAKRYLKIVILESGISETIHELDYFNGNFRCERWHWEWGYEPSCFEEDEKQFVIPAHGHEYTWIPEELRDGRFKDWSVSVGGGCESECLQDFLDILGHLGIDYQKVKGLIY